MLPIKSLHQIVWTCLMAALIATGSIVSIPFGPVPITLQDFFVMLTGLFLPRRNAFFAIALYLGAGTLGLPVFSAATGGVGVLLGPTGGYLFGFIILGFLCTFLKNFKTPIAIPLCVLFSLLHLLGGSVWLKFSLQIGFGQAFILGFAPFVPASALKSIGVIMLYKFLQRTGLMAHD